ncbi:hypothetical protein IC582_028361 [Cucumis melo]
MPNEDDTSSVVKFNIELEKPINVLEKKVDIGLEELIDVVDDEVEIEDTGKKLRTHFDSDVTEIKPFSTQRPYVWPVRRKRASVYLSTPFTLYLNGLQHQPPLPLSWPQYKECIKENRSFDWKEKYRLVNYVVGSKEDFKDPWANVDYVYSPFNVHVNHWVLLCLDLVSCQVKAWDSLSSLTSAEEMRNILLSIRELVPNLLDNTGFFARRGGLSTYKEPWPVVIVDSIPLQQNNSDCGVFTIKYFEYIAAGFDLDTLCQENMSYFRKQMAFQLWTNTSMY